MCLNPIELGAGLLASLKLYGGRWSCSELCQMENLAEVGFEKEQTRMILTACILFVLFWCYSKFLVKRIPRRSQNNSGWKGHCCHLVQLPHIAPALSLTGWSSLSSLSPSFLWPKTICIKRPAASR